MGQGPVCVDNRVERRWEESGCDASLRRCRSCSISLFDSQNRKKLPSSIEQLEKENNEQYDKCDKTYEEFDKSAIVYL